MPAHSNFEDALKGVTDYNHALANASQKEQVGRVGASKSSKHKKDKKKMKDGKKESKSKDHNKQKRKRKRKSSSEDESESDEESLELQLQRGRAAVRLTREIMFHVPEAKKGIRQMFWRLDNNEAVNISSMENEKLKSLLSALFTCLKLVEAKQGVYVKGTGDSILGRLGFVLDETPSERPKEESSLKSEATENLESGRENPIIPGQTKNISEEEQIDHDMKERGGNAHLDKEGLDNSGEEEDLGVIGCMEEPKQRIFGPIAPPRELLEQAAQVAQAMEAEEEADMIGPPPPDLILEIEAQSGDSRSAEVVRIIRIMKEAKQKNKPVSSYDLMDVSKESSSKDIKRKYWKLSLMIHPDKCDHPNADDAFQAISQAAKDLQDTGKREEIDRTLAKAEFDEFAEEQRKKDEIARQWRIAKNEATEEDLKGPIQMGPPKREEWITVLPQNRRPQGPSQKSQTSFSQQGVIGNRVDNSSWADTPQEKLLRLQHAGNKMLEAAENDERMQKKAEVVDKYNEKNRGETLFQQHKEKQKKEKRSKKDKKNPEASNANREGNHPWRPFDREKDLDVSGRPADQKQFLSKMGDLSSRFGNNSSSGGSRKFL